MFEIVPALPPHYFVRTRLREILLKGAPRLRLLCAPAGFGKSLLMQECVRYLPEHGVLCWLDGRANPWHTSVLLERIAKCLSLSDASMDAVSEGLSNCRIPFWIMLDHWPLEVEPNLMTALERLLHVSSAQVGWWMACRRRPSLPLTRLLLNGELTELDAGQLAVTESDFLLWLAQQGVPDQSIQAEGLVQRTGGWFAGLNICLLAVQSENEAHLAGQMLQDYLRTEVLEELSPRNRSLLCQLACLSSFDAPLYEQLWVKEMEGMPLSDLLEAAVFIEPVPGSDGMWRMQGMVADGLAESVSCKLRGSLYRRVSEYYLDSKQFAMAIDYACRGKHYRLVPQLLEQLDLQDLVMQQGPETLLRVLDQSASTGLFPFTPLQGWALFLAGRLDAAEKGLASSGVADELSGNHHDAQCKVLQAYLGYCQGQPDQAVAVLRQALPALPDTAVTERFMAIQLLLADAQSSATTEQVREYAASAAQLARTQARLPLEAWLVLHHSEYLQRRGELLRAERQVRMVLAGLQPESRQVCGRAHLVLGQNLWRQARIEEARSHYAQALCCFDAGSGAVVAWAYVDLAELDAASGNLEAALHQLAEAERLMQLRGVSPVLYLPSIHILRARIWLRKGQLERCAQLVDHYVASGAPVRGRQWGLHGNNLDQQFELLRLRTAVADGGEHCEELAARLKQSLARGDLWQACELGFAVAEAHASKSGRRKAQAALFDAVALLERMGGRGNACYWWSFRTEISRWVCMMASPESAHYRVDISQLSRREQVVLDMIAKGLSNQDIADQLHISLHTVKSHAQRINSKLGVSRRTQAVIRAKAMGIGMVH